MKLELVTAIAVSSSYVRGATIGLHEKRLNNGLGIKPALGWNSWVRTYSLQQQSLLLADDSQNAGQCNAASAKFALDTANKFISLGLKDLGYEYINIDDCWSTHARNATGHLVPDPSKWPNGIKPVVDQIHSMGLKFGLYGDAGTLTCAGYPGSEGYEVKDAQTLASWGVDYWKYDNCYTPCNGGRVQTCQSPIGNTRTWMTLMGDALAKSGGKIFYSLCTWGRDSVWTWGDSVGNSWRMSVDNWNDWASVVRIASAAAGISQYSKPGGFNDLDMMVRVCWSK